MKVELAALRAEDASKALEVIVSFRILLIMDPLIAVPPAAYGGIERVVADLIEELSNRGHSVTLWAAPGSRVQCSFEPFGRQGEWTRLGNLRNLVTLTARFWLNHHQFDVIHNFGRLAYLLPVLRTKTPKFQTYMRTVHPPNIRKVNFWSGGGVHFTAVSECIRQTGLPGGGTWSVVYNCAPVEQFVPELHVDPETAPLVFLGRLERCKGAHTAIAVARRLGRHLKIAGNLSDLPEERRYFAEEIQPHVDGELIEYVGEVDNRQKQDLLAGAAALLTPIEWREPFPVVLPEAFACGTPVISFRRGGVPEGIDHGRTGFLCDTAEEMVSYVLRLGEINRAACRREAELRFSPSAIGAEYERLYLQELKGRRAKAVYGAVPSDEKA